MNKKIFVALILIGWGQLYGKRTGPSNVLGSPKEVTIGCGLCCCAAKVPKETRPVETLKYCKKLLDPDCLRMCKQALKDKKNEH